MADVNHEGSLHEYGLEVLKAIAEIVGRTTGGDVHMDFVRDGEPDFGFEISVNDVPWCTARYTDDQEAVMTNHEPMRAALASLGLA